MATACATSQNAGMEKPAGLDELWTTLDSTPKSLSEELGAKMHVAPAPGAGDMEGPEVLVHFEETSALAVGTLLVDLDRELRRSAALLERRDAVLPVSGGKTWPVKPISGAALDLVSASPGSFEVVSVALGGVATALLSDPVQLAMTLSWFWEHRPSRWHRRHAELPEDVRRIATRVSENARQALAGGGSVDYVVDYRGRHGDLVVEFKASASPTGDG